MCLRDENREIHEIRDEITYPAGQEHHEVLQTEEIVETEGGGF